jgi:hypothetical protein
MIDLQVAVEELKGIIDRNIYDYVIPDRSGNTIKIGHTVIRKSRAAGYLIFDTRKQTQVGNTYSKPAAMVFAKNYLNNQDTARIMDLDRCLEKNEMDAVFYQHTIETTSSESRRAVAADRLENCELLIDDARLRLESLLLDK